MAVFENDGSVSITEPDLKIRKLQSRIAFLESLLREITENMFWESTEIGPLYDAGIQAGMDIQAAIARETREKIEGMKGGEG